MMLAFLGIAFLIYGSLHLYALGKVWGAVPHSAVAAVFLVSFGLLMTCSPLIIWSMGKQGWHGAASMISWVAYIWMGFLFLFCCMALVLDFSRVVIWLLGFKWPIGGPAALLSIALPALALTAYGLVEARQIRVEKLNITTPKLSAGKITIAQISDLHLGPMLGDAFLDRVIDIVRETRPDIVVATGDILDGQGDDIDELSRHFQELKPRDGAYAVIGNHEAYAGLESSLGFFENAGFTVLRGEMVSADGIILAGVDDPGTALRGKEMTAQTRKALALAHTNTFVVLLKHQPVVAGDVPFDLQLSGHGHGGQIFPFGFLTRLVYGVRAGLYRYGDGRLLYVSRGAGTWGPPMRFLAPPEVTLITIQSETK